MNDEPAIVAQGGLARLRELQALLAARGIEAVLVRPPGKRTRS